MNNEAIHELLNAKETESLRQLWQSGGELEIKVSKNLDFDWYPLWKKGYLIQGLVRSGQEPIYRAFLTALGRELATLLFEPVPTCPHCGKPLRGSEKG